jgi:anthranilate synthase/aminodeoxychorismate synthase-like glutamine amidotransferase
MAGTIIGLTNNANTASANLGRVPMLLLIDNYDSFTYNLAQYLGELGADVKVVRNDALGVGDVGAMAPERIVISPGPCTPNEAGVSLDVIRQYAGKIPILGVCLGHQAIGQAFGGRIVRAPVVMHGKISRIFHDEKGLFEGVENPFSATRYHSLVIEPQSCPDVLEITAKTWSDEIMGVRHKKYANTATPVEGVQFHPESIMTEAGKKLLGNFLRMGRTGLPAAA